MPLWNTTDDVPNAVLDFDLTRIELGGPLNTTNITISFDGDG
ncbi:unnamed protein product, partial [Rotaria magnacalcarata]